VNEDARIAGAPVSWGVIEIPDWGYQMPAERVLREAAAVGLTAMEAGPEVFLPRDPTEMSDVLGRYGLSLVGGFVPAVLHEPDLRARELALVERRAEFFSAAGADVLVLAAITSTGAFEQTAELDAAAWRALFESLSAVEEICARHGLTVALHHHLGTVIERDDQLRRFLEGCDTGLCLDTGHLVIGGSDPVEIAELAGDRVSHVHLKDVDRDLARRVATRELSFKEAARRGVFRPLGDGEVDVGEVVGGLERSGYRGWYVLEQDTVVEAGPDEGEGPVANVRKSLAFVRERLANVREGEQSIDD
jgi:inosose dehydratase